MMKTANKIKKVSMQQHCPKCNPGPAFLFVVVTENAIACRSHAPQCESISVLQSGNKMLECSSQMFAYCHSTHTARKHCFEQDMVFIQTF